MTLDFAGRRVLEEDDKSGVNMYDVNDDVIQRVHFGARPKAPVSSSAKVSNDGSDYLVNPNIVTQAPKVGNHWSRYKNFPRPDLGLLFGPFQIKE